MISWVFSAECLGAGSPGGIIPGASASCSRIRPAQEPEGGAT